MKFSYAWIKELAGINLTPQEAADILTSKSFEVEGISGEGDRTVLDIKILPNRPDCLSHLGVARELCALTGNHFTPPAYEYKVSEHPAVAVSVEDADACPRYSALMVSGIKVGKSPDWLKDRLELCGLKSINNVVDVTNYVMLELGQPMHAFDAKLVNKIIVRHAQVGEKLKALDEARTEYNLDESMLVIADSSQPLAIAGIKGGVNSGITDGTTVVLLEAANFNPQSIRATSRKLGLSTDASVRFAYGMDPNITAAALILASELLGKVAGASSNNEIIDFYPVHRTATSIILDPNYVNSLLGLQIGDAQIRSILESLGFDVTNHEDKLKVTLPTRRLDVTSAEDLIEEVGRMYGYTNITAKPPLLPIYSDQAWVREDNSYAWDEYAFMKERGLVAHTLVGAGYSEVYNYVFISDDLKNILKLDGLLELAQPQSSEYRWLRRSLVPRLLINARDNLRFTSEVKLFETGHVFDKIADSNDDGQESARLGLIIARKNNDKQRDLFYEIKGAVDLLLERCGIADYYYDDAPPFNWDKGAVNSTVSGKQALIRLEGSDEIVGFVGSVIPGVADAVKLKGAAAIAELDLRLLIKHSQEEREYEILPKYPIVTRDIAILVDQSVRIGDILETIESADDAQIVQDVDIFDIYEPTGREKIKAEGDTPEYGKSVAFHIIYRADDHTLTDPEVTLIEDKIKKYLQEKLGAQIR